MVGYIYLITDTTNGMKYTGQHHYNKEGELDPSYHGSGTIIKNIYKKRPETLKEEYIKTCYSEEEMNSDEQYYIEVFDTLWPHGYNLTKGGDGGIKCEEVRKKISKTQKGKHRSEETRKKISETLKGKHHSEEHKRKLSESTSGENHYMFGKHHSEETKRKMSDSHKGKPAYNKGKPMSEEQKKKLSKKVLQFTLDGEFVREWESISECGRNGFHKGAVSECCRGEKPHYKGYIWSYK